MDTNKKIELAQLEEQGLKDFVEVMGAAAKLPEEQRSKVTYFAQGIVAATPRVKEEAKT